MLPNRQLFSEKIAKLIATEGSSRIINSGASRIGELKRSFCKALTMPSLNLNPWGDVVACQRDGAPEYYKYGFFDSKTKSFIFDQEKIEFFRSLTVDSFPECSDCIAKYHCAGDCHDLRRAGVERCDVNKNLVLEFIKETILHDNSIF